MFLIVTIPCDQVTDVAFCSAEVHSHCVSNASDRTGELLARKLDPLANNSAALNDAGCCLRSCG